MNKHVIFLIILLQTIVAVAAGITASWLAWEAPGNCCLFVGDIDITSLDFEEAQKLVGEHYDQIRENGVFTLTVDDKEFDLRYSEVGLDISWERALETAYRSVKIRPSLFEFLYSFLYGRKIQVSPDYSLDKGLLMDRIREISLATARAPEDAMIAVKGETVVKTPEKNGYKLDAGIVTERVLSNFAIQERNHISFESESSDAFIIIEADTKIDDFTGLDSVISRRSVSLAPYENAYGINNLVEKFKGKVIENSEDHQEIFSYKKEVSELIQGIPGEAHDRMASAIYGAFLCSGIDVESIRRLPCGLPIDYTPPGTEACVSEGDLALSGMPFKRIMLWASVEDSLLEVAIVGPEEGKEKSYALHTETDQVLDAPVIYIQDSESEEREEVIEPGVPGLKVNVYRTMTANGHDKKELLYTDVYRPISKIVKVGYEESRSPSQK